MNCYSYCVCVNCMHVFTNALFTFLFEWLVGWLVVVFFNLIYLLFIYNTFFSHTIMRWKFSFDNEPYEGL